MEKKAGNRQGHQHLSRDTQKTSISYTLGKPDILKRVWEYIPVLFSNREVKTVYIRNVTVARIWKR